LTILLILKYNFLRLQFTAEAQRTRRVQEFDKIQEQGAKESRFSLSFDWINRKTRGKRQNRS
jgi:hypothetical protein